MEEMTPTSLEVVTQMANIPRNMKLCRKYPSNHLTVLQVSHANTVAVPQVSLATRSCAASIPRNT